MQKFSLVFYSDMSESEKKASISLKTGAEVDVQFSSDEELGTIAEGGLIFWRTHFPKSIFFIKLARHYTES